MEPQNPTPPPEPPEATPPATHQMLPSQEGSQLHVARQSPTIQPSDSFKEEMKSETVTPTHPTLKTDSIYPEPTNHALPGVVKAEEPAPDPSSIGLTGSQMQGKKVPLPIGIYIIVGILGIGFIISFFSANNGLLFTILSFINLFLAGGLLLRKESIRKAMIITSSILIILFVLEIVGLYAVHHRAEQRAANAETALTTLQHLSNELSSQQQSEVNTLKAAITTETQQLNKDYNLAYIRALIVIAADAGLVIYLTRSKVKSVFM